MKRCAELSFPTSACCGAGSILIAVNPFARLPHLYGVDMMEQYRGRNLGELSPHVFAIADSAFRQMQKEKRSQSILVRGVCVRPAFADKRGRVHDWITHPCWSWQLNKVPLYLSSAGIHCYQPSTGSDAHITSICQNAPCAVQV